MPYENSELHDKLTYWSKCFSVTTIVVGGLVLLGWLCGLEILKRPIPNLVSMNPLTAIFFICSGSTLLLILSSKAKGTNNSFILPLSIFILAVSTAELAALLIGFEFPADSLLFRDKLNLDIVGNQPNRMAPNTIFNFFLTGLAFFYIGFNNHKAYITSQIFTLGILFIGLLSLLGYLYQVNSFYGLFKYIPMAIHTSITFIILALAMLFIYPDKGIMRNFTSKYTGSTSARFLIPAAVIIPTILGYFRLLGDWNGLYSKEFGVAILILSTIILFLVFIWFNAASLNKKDALQKEAEANLRKMNAELEKKVEQRTREVINNEKKFRSMVENASDIISLIDEHNTVLYVNPAIQKITGFTLDEILKLERGTLILPEEVPKAQQNLRKTLENPGKSIPVSIKIQHKNDKKIWLEGFMTNLLHDENIKAIVTNYRDVTERKEAETRAIESENRIWNTLDKMMEGIQIIDRNWKYMYVNEAVAKQGKYSKEDLLGHTIMEKYPGIENSELFKVMSTCMTEKISGFLENEFEYNDGSKGWFELSIQPVPEGVFILSIDVTRRKTAEADIRKLNAELEERVEERTAQLEAVNKELESFSYSISHDLRAPLRAVHGYSKMIEEDYSAVLDDEGKRLLNIVQYNAQRMGTLIDDLLAFSRLGKKEIQKADINTEELIDATIHEHNKIINHKAEIKKGSLHNIQADYSLIYQVFYNLLSNAIKYSSKKENPVVTISSEIRDNEVIYSIRDNGAGFDMKYGHKLFGVFQRLHANDEFEGTGVGLAIVQRIVNKHGGRTWAEGKINEGATFFFSLPLNK
jgi:PAS domain S-box-containing protein